MATTITANGINFPDGSASAPSIGGTDTNTGLFTGSDIVGFATGGVERIRIDANGKVCINNDTALSDLHICTAGSSEQDGTLRLGGQSAGLGLVLDYDQASATVSRITANPTYNNTSALLKICVDGDTNPNQLVLRGDGRVGIGIADNDEVDLQVVRASSNGSIRVGGNSGSGVGLDISYDNSSTTTTTFKQNYRATNAGALIKFDSGYFTFHTGTAGGEKLRITSAGLFGFNNTSPGGACIDATHSRTNAYGTTSDHRGLAQIVARNASDAPGRFASISLVSGGGTQAEASINLVQTGNYQGDLTFKSRTAVSAWTEKMRISANKGLLLLGTTDTSGYSNRCAYFHNGNHGDNWNYVSITGATNGGAGIVFGDSTGQDGGNYESYMYHNNNGNDFSIVTDRGNKEFRFKQGGDLSIIDGNLALASGHGIDFSATGNGNGTMGDELLDDYEQGTWSPTIYGGTTAGSYSYQANRTGGKYTRIGNMVYIEGVLRIESITTAGAGDLYMGGMPYSTSAPMASAWTIGKGVQFFMYGTNGNTTASIAEPPFVGTASGGQSAFNIRSYGKNLNVMPQIEDFDNQWWIFQVAGWYPVN